MRAAWTAAEPYRLPRVPGYFSQPGDRFGVFLIKFKGGVQLYCLATDGDYRAAGLGPEFAWEHVSVSTKNRTPNWYEMDFVKDIFWTEDETVMQLHVPKKEHRNLHPHVLHLWRPINSEIPRPPSGAVA